MEIRPPQDEGICEGKKLAVGDSSQPQPFCSGILDNNKETGESKLSRMCMNCPYLERERGIERG